MLNTCSGRYPSKDGKPERNHEEIVFDGKDCPLCEALDRVEELEEANTLFKEEVVELNNQLCMCTDACDVCPNRFECVTNKGTK